MDSYLIILLIYMAYIMMKLIKNIVYVSIMMLLILSSVVYAYKFDFVTVTDIVSKVQKKFEGLETYQAQFKITSEKLGKKIIQRGVIKYKDSGRLLIDFHQPYGQKIVSDGKSMWIYIPAMNVVAEQDLENDAGLFSSASGAGLKRLFRKYHYRFASKEQPKRMKDGDKKYTLLLRQKEKKSGFRKIKLWISEDFFIEKATGETSTGKTVEITFSKIQTDLDLPNGEFKFDMPAHARIIRNPMISEE